VTIFNYLDYREYLSDECKRRKKDQPGFTQDRLATRSGIRSAYFSNVLKGRANLNSDQIFAVSEELALPPHEGQFLMLLKEFDQCVSQERKARLKEEITEIQSRALKTESHISVQVRRNEHELIMKYYGDPWIKVVHVLLQIPRYASDTKLMADDINMTETHLNEILNTLQELEIIRWSDKKVEVLAKNFHLPKDSAMLLPHQFLMRMKSAVRMQEVPADKRYSFSVTFSSTEKVREAIQQKLLGLLAEIQPMVKSGASENAYQLNFDLFPWNNLG
jgi:uncharacterized protein (TIGR02147 family)